MSSVQPVATLISTLVIALAAVLGTGASGQLAYSAINTSQEPPTRPVLTVSRSPTCELRGPLIRISSRSVRDGVQVRVSPPTVARYAEGAPIVVHSAAAPSFDRASACLSEHGFVDVSFQCPGSRDDGSERDARLGTCAEALADVLAFATGQVRSTDNKSIEAYTGNIMPWTANVGVLGASAGGNRAVLAMARYGDRFPQVKWFASWESPVLTSIDGGWGSVFQTNRFYDPATGRIDLSRLRYSAEMPLWVWPIQRLPREPNWPLGGLYLDGDGNNTFNKDADYAFWVTYDSPASGQVGRAFYTPMIVREARDRGLFGPTWPTHIATLQEVEERARSEDVLPHIREVVARFPGLAVIVFESEVGHVTAAADHPHAIAHVNAWLDAGARWVRFNPDAHYVERVMGKKPARVLQYPAGKGLDRTTIASLLEPEEASGGPSDAQGMAAMVCELADRTYRNNWAEVLTGVVVN
jgi:hypothetical protein